MMKQFVEVHYYVKDGMRDEFYRTILEQGIADASRSEKGNEKYDYYLSPENENELLLIELWSSAEAVQAHGQTQHFQQLSQLKQKYVADTAITRYAIAED